MYQATLAIFLSLLSFALAAPVSATTTTQNAWQYGAGGGVVGFIVLILDIIAIRMPPSLLPLKLSGTNYIYYSGGIEIQQTNST